MKPLGTGRRVLRSLRRRWDRLAGRPPRTALAARSQPRVPQVLDRETFIAAPSPIEKELRAVFGREEPITIFDIGSCEGEDAIRYARLFPKARIFAFEPLPANVALLRDALARHDPGGRITVLEVALWDRDGTASLHVSAGQPDDRPLPRDWDYGNKSSSLLPPDRHREVFPWITFDQDVEVPTERLDSLCGRLGIAAVDFLHIDVQGAELAVLEGAGAVLDRVRVVWMEVEAIELYRGQPVKADVESFMAAHGFVVAKDTVGRVSGDQLYARPADAARMTASRTSA